MYTPHHTTTLEDQRYDGQRRRGVVNANSGQATMQSNSGLHNLLNLMNARVACQMPDGKKMLGRVLAPA